MQRDIRSILFVTIFFWATFLINPCHSQSTEGKGLQTWGDRWSQIQKSFSDYNNKIGFQPYISPLIRRDQAAQKISINITELDTLVLTATIGYDDYHQDHAVWGEATLFAQNGKQVRLSDLTPLYSSTGWSTMVRNQNYSGNQLQIASRKFDHGIIAHAHSEIVYLINGEYERFESYLGIDQNVDSRGDVRFKVSSRPEKNTYEALDSTYKKTSSFLDLSTIERYMWLFNNSTLKEQKDLVLSRIEKLGENGNSFRQKFNALSEQNIPNYDFQWFELYSKACKLEHAITEFKTLNTHSLKNAIIDLLEFYPHEYFKGKIYLSEIKELEETRKSLAKNLAHLSVAEQDQLLSVQHQFSQLKKEALGANPLLKKGPILFVVRNQYKSDHHNTATIFQNGEVNTSSYQGGGAIKTIDFANGGQIRTLIENDKSVYRDTELHFDGNRIIFSMRKDITDDYHIYQMHKDGSGLKQLTSAPGVADIDPNYLPDGGIVFSSTREPKYCMCNIHIMANLFRMDADGANIFQIGKSTLFEGHSSIMPDGRILYDRWEYIDRNFGDAQGLWTVNPDGTNHSVYWGNNTNSPGGVIDARSIPGTANVIAVLGSCHDRPWGALGIINRQIGLDLKGPIIQTWPASAIDLVGKGDFDTFKQVRPRYEDPYPLSSKYFLCSRTINDEEMGIFLIDVFGNELLLHTEGPGCFDPMPIAPRLRPPQLASRQDFTSLTGQIYVQDVYLGTHMEGVKRGAVKTLRIIESPEKRFWTEPAWNGQGVHRPGLNWHSFENKRILGEVPVEKDGSAFFEVPANTFIYFQLLDENGKMVQSMRSGTIVQAGEKLGCVGCHDNRMIAPPQTHYSSMATLRQPNKMTGWYGETKIFNYMEDVQPIFDRHCVSCHDFGKKAGEKLLLTGDRNMFFNASYIELWQKKYINSIGAGPSEIQPAYSWGSNSSTLVETIESGHKGIQLSKKEYDRINTWIDINGVYYPNYSSAYPNNLAGRSPLNDNQIKRLKELTGIDFFALAGHNRTKRPQISFERPELSPCLENIKDKNSVDFREAVSIITAGLENLKSNPRADMKFFIANKKDQNRQQKYMNRKVIDQKNKIARTAGQKMYDPSFKSNE
jgi:hypothetical protein